MFNNGYTRAALLILAVVLVARMVQTYYKPKEPLNAGTSGNVSYGGPTVVGIPTAQTSQMSSQSLQAAANLSPAPATASVAEKVAGAGSVNAAPYSGISLSVPSNQGSLNLNVLRDSAAEQLSIKPAGFDLNPADLLPIPDPALIPNVVPDPGFSRNFLLNSLQSGVPTGSKRNFNYDMRKSYAPPITAIPLFDQPTIIPDMNRKTWDTL